MRHKGGVERNDKGIGYGKILEDMRNDTSSSEEGIQAAH